MKRTLLAAFGAAVLATGLQTADAKTKKAKTPEPFGDDLLVQVKSTLDGTLQPCWFWAPEKAKTEAVPLIVGLHTWSADYTYKSHYATALNYAKGHDWAMVGPNFRGANKTPPACGADAAVQDIVDAVNYAKGKVKIDEKRVYIIGGSGGGHMTLLMAGRHPEIWAGCAAFCPITDIARWHADSLLDHPGRGKGYAKMLEQACGGTPAEKPEEYRHRSPLTWIENASGRSMRSPTRRIAFRKRTSRPSRRRRPYPRCSPTRVRRIRSTARRTAFISAARRRTSALRCSRAAMAETIRPGSISSPVRSRASPPTSRYPKRARAAKRSSASDPSNNPGWRFMV